MSDTAQAVHAGDVGERGAGGTQAVGVGERKKQANGGNGDRRERSGTQPDPLTTLREYRSLAPWGLRDLAALAGGILDASGVVPVNAAARAQPSERTIRFYVASRPREPPMAGARRRCTPTAISCRFSRSNCARWKAPRSTR